MEKNILSGIQSLEQLSAGVTLAARTVISTYDPYGTRTLLSSDGVRPTAATDGFSVLKALDGGNSRQTVGMRLAQALAGEMSELCGDASTTAMLLLSELVSGGLRLISAGNSYAELNQGICDETARICAAMEEAAVPLKKDDVEAFALFVCGEPELASLIAEAMEYVQYKGNLSVKASGDRDSHVEKFAGMKLSGGYISPLFAKGSGEYYKSELNYTNPLIFLCGSRIESIESILSLLNEVSLSGETLIVIADSLSEPVLRSMLSNVAEGRIKLCAVKCPGYGSGKLDYLEDIAAYTGGTVFGTAAAPDLRRASIGLCGRAVSVRITETEVLLSGGQRNPHAFCAYIDRLNSLRRLEKASEKAKTIQERINNLTENSAIVRVGAATELERLMLHRQAEKAVTAVRTALRSGVLCGGGCAYVDALKTLAHIDEPSIGASLVDRAVLAPLRQLCSAAPNGGGRIVDEILHSGLHVGYDAASGRIAELPNAGILDSAESAISALRKASSLACEILSAAAIVYNSSTPADDLMKAYG